MYVICISFEGAITFLPSLSVVGTIVFMSSALFFKTTIMLM